MRLALALLLIQWQALGGMIDAQQMAQFQPLRLKPVAQYLPGSPLNTMNGNGFSQINDLTGNAHHLTNGVAANQPTMTNTVNGMKAAYFDGSNDYLKAPAFTLTQPETVVGVFEQVTWTLNDTLIEGDTSNSGRYFQNFTSPKVRITAGTNSTEVASWGIGTFAISTVLFNGGSSSITINNATPVVSGAGTNSMGGLVIGANIANGAYGNIKSASVSLFDRVLTTNEQSYMVQGNARRYGINIW